MPENDIRFKGKTREEWSDVEEYLKEYVGKFYEIAETSEKIYIGKEFPDEFSHGKDKTVLKGSNAKAKANVSQAVGELVGYNIYKIRMLARHAHDGKLYLKSRWF